MRVTGIGQCCLDYLAVFDGYPEINTKMEALLWEEQGGGPVATALAALSRLGVETRFHGIIGDDDAGEKIRRSLIREGVQADGLLKREKAVSQRAFIAIDKGSGQRTIFWKRPSGAALSQEELGPGFLEGTDFLLLDGLMRDASLFAARKAGEKGIPVMLDAGRLRDGMLELAKECDYVVMSEEFARDMGWKGSDEALQKEAKKISSGIVTVTLGEKGSVTFYQEEIIRIPAFEVKVADTTGAGDVFHAGYVFGLLKKWDMKDTLVFASALAALKCRRIGARAGVPGLEEVMRFLEEKAK